MADRMIVMNQGVAEQIGTPLEVYERPQSLFAAQFIGSPAMNIFKGKIDGDRLELANGLKLSFKSENQDVISGEVRVGIRPEHLYLDDNGGLKLNTGFTEPLGATTLLHGKLGDSTETLTVSLPGVHSLASVGSVVRLSVDPAQIHLFHPESGLRM